MSSTQAQDALVSQLLNLALTAQNSCPVHEQCPSSCPSRIGVRRYWQSPTGERLFETDRRAAYAETQAHPAQQQPPRQPMTIDPRTLLFSHIPLDDPSRQIRLLRLDTRAYFRADPVVCELVTFAIDATPSFGAVSYVWGEDAADRKMLCNGAVFLARPSLETALKKMRAGFAVRAASSSAKAADDGKGYTYDGVESPASDANLREEYLWADAICIDQGNAEEKAAQIQLMGGIFAAASTVYVDLGGGPGESISVGGVRMTLGAATGGMGRQDVVHGTASPDFPLTYKTVLFALSRPWFTRTWIIQETVLARRLLFMMGGNVFLQHEFDAFLAQDTLSRDPDRFTEIMSNPATMRGYLNYIKIHTIRRDWERRERNSLSYMLLTRDFDATMAKDKIFGLLSLMRDDDRAAIGSYTSCVEDVFEAFAKIHVLRGSVSALLDHAGLQRRRLKLPTGAPSLPSWVPDWTAQGTLTGPKSISTLRPVPYAASGSIQGTYDFKSSPGGLFVQGFLIDTLETVVEFGGLESPADCVAVHARVGTAFDKKLGRRKKLFKKTKSVPVYADPDDALARTLLMGDTYAGGNAIAHSSPISDPSSTYKTVLSRWKEGRAWRPNGLRMDSVETFDMQVGTTCFKRSFAITKMGYTGLVSSFARPGDVVALIFGSQVLHVLRPGQVGYFLVGDAYVHGFMEGEAVQYTDSNGVRLLLI